MSNITKPKFPSIKYTNRDFNSIRNDLLEYAKRYYPDTYRDFNEASFGSLMVDSLAYIGDMLSLWQAGVKNIIVLFGIKISTGILNTLLRLDPQCITISLNNDEGGSSAGSIAAEQARKKLLKFFDTDQVKVAFPYENDFGEMTTESVIRWSKSHG